MSTQNEPDQQVEPAPPPPVEVEHDGDEHDGTSTADTDRDGREAARYRRRLRDTEAERDRMAATVQSYQRRDVESAATELAAPGDLWLAGVQLPDLLDEGGQVDQDKVREAVAGILAERPHWRTVPRPVSFDGGPRPAVPAESGEGWSELLGQGRSGRR